MQYCTWLRTYVVFVMQISKLEILYKLVISRTNISKGGAEEYSIVGSSDEKFTTNTYDINFLKIIFKILTWEKLNKNAKACIYWTRF